jgi:hypothetical protein
MAYELTFTVHRVGTSQCDLCSNRVGYGFETTAHGTPIFFHCGSCVYTTYSELEVDGALLARERLLAQIEQQRRDELVEEEAYRDAVMCAWIDFETVYGEDKMGAA